MSDHLSATPDRWHKARRKLSTALRRALPFAGGVLAALVAILLYTLLVPRPAPLTPGAVSALVAQTLASATPAPANSALAFQAIRPAFVLIQTDETGQGSLSGLGSGVIVSERGDILTSLHVVAGASRIKLTFADGTEADAKIAVARPEQDIAVLTPSALPPTLSPATLGNPNALRIGDEVYAVGNPLGLYASMSAGVVSGLQREFDAPNGGPKLKHMIQIDAAVNPGNSGGPLVNRAGQVVGIVTGLVNPESQKTFIGIGFAVPIDVAGGAAGLPPY